MKGLDCFVALRALGNDSRWLLRRVTRTSLGSCRTIDRASTPQLLDVREERRFLATDPMAIQSDVGADDRFGAALADDEGLAAAPTALGTPVGEKA
jgi:hypothetical protein